MPALCAPTRANTVYSYANWEEPSPTTAFNGISVCGPDCFPEAVQFALETSPDASIDDLGALACGYFGSTGLYTPDPVDILTPIWASRGRGDCEDFAITAVAMLRCCEPEKYSGKVAEVGRRVKTWNPKMVCGYVEMDTGMTGTPPPQTSPETLAHTATRTRVARRRDRWRAPDD